MIKRTVILLLNIIQEKPRDEKLFIIIDNTL